MEMRLGEKVLDRQQLDAGDAQIEQVVDHLVVAEAEIAAAQR